MSEKQFIPQEELEQYIKDVEHLLVIQESIDINLAHELIQHNFLPIFHRRVKEFMESTPEYWAKRLADEYKGVRTCIRCGIEKPLTSFPMVKKYKGAKRKRKNFCRSCSTGSTKNTIPKETKLYVLERDKYICHYCGKYGDTVDHIIPRALGGSNYHENLICACANCNSRRGHMTMDEFKQLLKNTNK